MDINYSEETPKQVFTNNFTNIMDLKTTNKNQYPHI